MRACTNEICKASLEACLGEGRGARKAACFDLDNYNLEKPCLHYVTTSLWKHITLIAMGLN